MYNLTLQQVQKQQKDKLQELIDVSGTRRHLAIMLGVPLSTVLGWVDRGRISKAGASLVQQHTALGEQFKAEDLRPDINLHT